MIDETYRNAFKEVYIILENTEVNLLNRIPIKFIEFIKNNMNEEYITNIQTDIEIDKQNILKETEAILALIYRSYWATEEEKIEFAKKDRKEKLEQEELKKQSFKDINEIFEKRIDISKVTLNNELMVIKKENIIKRFLNRIINILKKKK